MSKIRRNILLLKVFTFLEDSRFYLPITIIYFTDITGSFTLGMSLFSVIMLTQALGELPLGIFSDFLGRKKTLIIGSILAFFSVFLYAIGGGYMTLLFGAISHGLARTFFSGNNQALLYESLEELGRKEDFSVVSGKIESLKELALGSTALMGSIIAWYYSLGVLFWITTLPLLACIAVACMITEPSKYSKQINNNIFIHTKEAIKVFLGNSKLKRVSLASSLDYAVSEALFNFIPAFIATLWSTSMVGIYRFLLHIFGFIGFYFSGYIIKKYGELRSLYIFSSVESIFVVIAIIIGNIFSPILLSVSTLNYGIKTTSVQAIMQREFSSNKRATMGSINALLGTLLLALIFLILGFLADTIGVLQTFLLAQLVLVVPLMIYYKLFSTHERT